MRIRKTIRRNYRAITRTITSGKFSIGLTHENDGSVGMRISIGHRGKAQYEIILQESEALSLLKNCIWHLETSKEEVQKCLKERKIGLQD